MSSETVPSLGCRRRHASILRIILAGTNILSRSISSDDFGGISRSRILINSRPLINHPLDILANCHVRSLCHNASTLQGATPMADDMTLKDVSAALRKAIDDLRAAGIEPPASLLLAAILAQRHAIDDRSKP